MQQLETVLLIKLNLSFITTGVITSILLMTLGLG